MGKGNKVGKKPALIREPRVSCGKGTEEPLSQLACAIRFIRTGQDNCWEVVEGTGGLGLRVLQAGWSLPPAHTHRNVLNIKLWTTPRYMLEEMREEQNDKEGRRTELGQFPSSPELPFSLQWSPTKNNFPGKCLSCPKIFEGEKNIQRQISSQFCYRIMRLSQ